MRLIDADALIKIIEEYTCNPCKKYYADNSGQRCPLCIAGDCLKAIEQQPTIEPEWKPGKWIPIYGGDGQLPEVDEDGVSDYILLSFSNYSLLAIGRYEADKDGGGMFYEGDDDRPLMSYGLFVNAWMPLPESYREDET